MRIHLVERYCSFALIYVFKKFHTICLLEAHNEELLRFHAIPSTFCLFCTQKRSDEPIHILNIALRFETQDNDDNYAAMFGEFCIQNVSTPNMC